MNMKSQASSLPSRLRIALYFLFGIVLLDYIAQIPYYMHFYGINRSIPNILGVGVFLILTFALFLVGYLLTLQARKIGGWLLLTFLVLEFVGYLVHNLSGAFLQDLPTNDPLFFTVSLIGYLNLIVPFVYVIVIVKNRRLLLFQQQQATSEGEVVAGTPPGIPG
jgi:hypothetical protein